MLAFFRKIFSPPVFEQDDDKTRSAALLNPILLGTIALLAFMTIIQGFIGAKIYLSVTTAVLAFLVLLSIGMWLLMKRGYVHLAGFVFVTLGWIALTIQAWTYSGLRDTAIIAYILIILASGLLIGLRTSIGYAAISLIASWVFAYFETIGKYNGMGDTPYPTAIELTIIFILVTLISYIAVNHINQSLKKSRISEQELRISNQELRELQANLEQRGEERTNDLERRNTEIQTAAQIARDATTARNIDVLLNRTVQLIHSKFGYYHIGIFQVDENGEYAVLKAAGSEAGKLMLANKYKIRIGDPGTIGYVASTGKARIILDLSAEPIHLQNPLLPYSHSELTLPLRVENRIIGILDIQSDKVNAFDQNSISIMQIVTDQISVAIERTNLFQELQQNTLELERALQENTSRAWQAFLQQIRKRSGYRYEGVTVEAVDDLPKDSQEAMQKSGQVVTKKSDSGKASSILSVPIRLRGQALGVLNLKFQGKEIPQETMQLIDQSADRLALALENARLVQDAQRLARREQQINTISAQIQQSADLEMVLQNTVRELGNVLGIPQTFIQIGLINPESKKE